MKEIVMQDPAPPISLPKKSHRWLKGVVIMAIVLVVGVAGWLGWQLWLVQKQHTTDVAYSTQLRQQIELLNKQLTEAKAAASKTTAPATATACSPTISQNLKDNLAAAVGSQNDAALIGYMANSVDVVVAASGKTGTESPTQAVNDMSYLNSATGPWNFSLPASTITSWATHFYKQYFVGNFYAGEATSNQVISYQFDCNGKVNGVFMASDASLLTQ